MPPEANLKSFGLTLEDAADLPRGVRKNLASYLLRHGSAEDARELLRVICLENPDRRMYQGWLALAHLRCGDVEEADRVSTSLSAEYPDSKLAAKIRAEVLFDQGEREKGLEEFSRFYDRPRESMTYWTMIGSAAQRRGSWNQARTALRRAFEIHESRKAESDGGLPTPAMLWQALAEQDLHDELEDSPYERELAAILREEEKKLRAAISQPTQRKSRAARETRVAEPRPHVAPVVAEPPPDANPDLQAKLKQYFGYECFRPGQQKVIELVLEGKSALAVMPTGAGKSLCYQLPAMLLGGITLVVSPLIALMKDQVDGLPAVMQQQTTLINSSLEGDEIERRLREISSGRFKLIYAAPERLRQRPFLHALRRRGVSLVVVDEAHCVSMRGHDFRPDYLFIGDVLEYLGAPAVLGMTATATPEMRLEISNHFRRQMHIVNTGTHRPNLFFESTVVRSDEDKMRELLLVCREIDGPGIVYVRSRRKTEELARLLRRERVQAAYYHAGMESEERTITQEQFMDGRWRVMCATVAFGMGIDKADVRFVIHYSLPGSLEDYYQEAGRAGRDGLPSRCTLLSTPSDKANLTRWMRRERVNIELPRRCYEVLRGLTTESRFAAVPSDEFERELQEEETRVRVAISLLESAGLVRRHLDVPTTMTVSVTSKGASEGSEEFRAFTSEARLKVNQRMPLETLDLSNRSGIAPQELEEKLLGWRDEGFLAYHGSGRVMLLERLIAARGAKGRVERMLQRYAEAQENRVAITFDYAESRRCRHALIGEHFGEQIADGCCSCDNCAPASRPTAAVREQISRQARPLEVDLSEDEKRMKVLETVRMIPGKVGFTGLVRVLKGSVASGIKANRCPNFGIFAAEPKTTIERRVGLLLEEGALVRDDSEYRLISPGRVTGPEQPRL